MHSKYGVIELQQWKEKYAILTAKHVQECVLGNVINNNKGRIRIDLIR